MIQNVETKRWGNNDSGAAVVEFAVIVVLLLLITFGILEFAFIFYQRHFIENAAREGVRFGIKANNFETFVEESNCSASDNLNRYCAVVVKVRDNYLPDFFENIRVEPDKPNGLPPNMPDLAKTLTVSVTVDNFFPRLLSGFIPGIPDQGELSYSATGIYEDPVEYDSEYSE
jgi:hypothetical protein